MEAPRQRRQECCEKPGAVHARDGQADSEPEKDGQKEGHKGQKEHHGDGMHHPCCRRFLASPIWRCTTLVVVGFTPVFGMWLAMPELLAALEISPWSLTWAMNFLFGSWISIQFLFNFIATQWTNPGDCKNIKPPHEVTGQFELGSALLRFCCPEDIYRAGKQATPGCDDAPVTQYSCICQLFVDGGYAAENAGHSYSMHRTGARRSDAKHPPEYRDTTDPTRGQAVAKPEVWTLEATQISSLPMALDVLSFDSAVQALKCCLARCFAAVYRAGYFSRFTSTAGAKLYENQRWIGQQTHMISGLNTLLLSALMEVLHRNGITILVQLGASIIAMVAVAATGTPALHLAWTNTTTMERLFPMKEYVQLKEQVYCPVGPGFYRRAGTENLEVILGSRWWLRLLFPLRGSVDIGAALAPRPSAEGSRALWDRIQQVKEQGVRQEVRSCQELGFDPGPATAAQSSV
ncbi:PFA3 [Symbiodinium sp. CCMP2456]|nr:PFA3 [Symbiodinium sp. CCMP2456]